MIGAWRKKFADAGNGLRWAMGGHSSFAVHLVVAAAVLAVAAWLRLPTASWATLFLAIGLVVSTELVNTAIEELVRIVHPSQAPTIGRVLDIAAGSVLVASLSAILVGLCILGPPLWTALAR